MALRVLLETGPGRQTTFFQENETSSTLPGTHSAHPRSLGVCSDRRDPDESTPHGPGPCIAARRLWKGPIQVQSQHLHFVSYSNHMQYLEDVSGEWPCTKTVLVAMYNETSLSSSIFKCRINLFLLPARRMNKEVVPPLLKLKKERILQNTSKANSILHGKLEWTRQTRQTHMTRLDICPWDKARKLP